MRALLSAIAAAILLSGCTYHFTRTYAIDPAQNLSLSEQQQVFQVFGEFLSTQGLRTFETDSPSSVAYEISGSAPDDWDMLELAYTSEDGFRLRLIRIISYPIDFSDDYLKDFVRKTEAFIQRATSKPIRIKLVTGSRT